MNVFSRLFDIALAFLCMFALPFMLYKAELYDIAFDNAVRNADLFIARVQHSECLEDRLVEELESVAEAWNRVFPGDKAPDGRRVERLFVTGNHDLVGYTYANSDKVAHLYPDVTERKRHLLHSDMAAQWERIFGEPYRPAFVKAV